MYIDTKALTANLGSQIKLKLESNASKQNKNGPTGPFVVYEYEVLNNNQVKILSASEALHNKIKEMDLKTGDEFLLSMEKSYRDASRKFWKVEKCFNPSGAPDYAKAVNDLKIKESTAQKAVDESQKKYVTGATLGMLFNQTCENMRMLYSTSASNWESDLFVNEFARLQSLLYAVEEGGSPDRHSKPNEPSVDPDESVDAIVDEDDLPF